jgi:hypothetical protein
MGVGGTRHMKRGQALGFGPLEMLEILEGMSDFQAIFRAPESGVL